MRLAILSLLLLANCAAPAASRQSARLDAEFRSEEEQREQTRADLEELLARAKAKPRAPSETAPAADPAPAPAPAPAAAPAPQPLDPFDDILPAGHIAAEVIARVHAAGPHKLLRALETEPARVNGTVVGFRIVSLAPDAAFLRRAQLLPGDIILSVNGASIITPDAFMKVWSALPKATAIDLAILRGTATLNRHWDIDAPAVAPAP